MLKKTTQKYPISNFDYEDGQGLTYNSPKVYITTNILFFERIQSLFHTKDVYRNKV